jgi:tripartite-type tricarboxylate transporter receptor subunit TctC
MPFMLVLHPAVPVSSVKEFVALAKAKPTVYGSTGGGGIGHLTHEWFNFMTGIKATHVPYKGTGPIVTALLAGEVPAGMVNLSGAYGHVRSGKLKSLAITTLKRVAFAPELPTMAESGLPGFESGTWYGLAGPRGMPQPAVQTLNREMTAALKTEIKEKLAVLGVDLAPSTPQWFATYIRDEIAKWGKVVKVANIRVE